MFEQLPQSLQQRVKQLATAAQEQADPCSWFEPLYAEAEGEAAKIPWAKLSPHPDLQDWLQTTQPQGTGKTALVVGCGLGDDAEALSTLGFQVTAFDIAPTAIAWCQQRFPQTQVNYQVADLFNLPFAGVKTFDLVFECRNLQALPLSLRSNAIAAIAPLVAAQGHLVVITRLRDQPLPPEGPPWPLSNQELAEFEQYPLKEIQRTYPPTNPPNIQMARIVYQKLT